MMPLEHTKKEVRDELVHSLQEWGVNRTFDKLSPFHLHEHYKFRQKAILDCMANLSAMPLDGQIDYQALKSQKFPTNYSDAYEHVLRNDDVPDIVNTYTDTLDGEGFLEPYFRNIDRRTGDIVGYRLKHAYQKLSSTQLDPLYRFSFHRTEREELIFKRWFLEDYASTYGVVFEALLSCHMLQAEPCYNCKAQNTLRWNGGGNTSWQDIVCTNCKATFEVKTKATLEKLETALRFNNIQGGSFTAWCELKNSKQSGHKMYLVILPRQHTFNRKMQKGKVMMCVPCDYSESLFYFPI